MPSRKHHVLTIGILTLAPLLWTAAPIQASLVTQTFEATVTDGPLAGTLGNGSFTYDDSLIVNGDETIDAASGLTLEFEIFGQHFTQEADDSYPILPFLEFDQFVPDTISFQVSEPSTDIVDARVEGFFVGRALSASAGVDFTTGVDVTYFAAPTPGTLALVLLGIGMRLARRRACSAIRS